MPIGVVNRRNEEAPNLGRAVIFRGFGVVKTEDIKTGESDIVEILPVQEVTTTHIQADRYVLPVEDATILNSEDGLVYVYNASLPYLKETAHLAEVEKNIVMGQMFLYPGRNMPKNGPNLFQWALVLMVFVLAALAIFK